MRPGWRDPAVPATLLLAVLLLGLPALPVSKAANGDPPAWWGDTTPKAGFHLRVAVKVNNTYGYPVGNIPAVAELDLGAKLVEAGWISSPAGAQRILKSFELDQASVRVVAMVNLKPQQGGTGNGQMRVVDPSRPPSDPGRFELPSTFFPGALRDSRVTVFDARSNPFVSVVWRIPETLQPGEERAFMVYFDTVANGRKAPAERSGPLGSALDSLFWAGAGLQLYGRVLPAAGQVATVTVIGTLPATSVRVFAAPPGGIFQPVKPPQGFPGHGVPEHNFTVGAGQALLAYVSTGQAVAFRLEASKPILAQAISTGFVPSLDGGVAGRQFLFALTQPTTWEQDTIYFTAASGEPTTVQVTSLATGNVAVFTMNGAGGAGSNGHPYTVGARSAGFSPGCTAAATQATAPLLPTGPALYQATVVSGGPVLLQLQHASGLVPVPTVDGASAGKLFYATSGWSDQGLTNNGCVTYNRVGAWFAAGADGPAGLKVTSQESPGGVQVDPPGAPTAPVPSPPTRTVPAGADGIAGPFPAPFPDRPLLFEASAPVQLFTGLFPPQVGALRGPGSGGAPQHFLPVYAPSSVPVINGPLWGLDTARSFVGMGPTDLIAPFQDTQVHATLRYQSGASRAIDTVLGANGTLFLDNLPGPDLLASFKVDSSKPIFAYPTLGPAATLAGIPPILKATPLQAEYRGYLVKLASPTGLDPVTGATTVNTSVQYTIEVTNLARTATGGDLPDEVSLSLGAPTEGWTARLEGLSTFRLASGETRQARVVVTPGPAAEPGSLGVVGVRAMSHGNPAMQDALQVVTLLKRSFDVGIWFDRPVDGPKQKPDGKTSPGETKEYDVWVQNLGSERDRIQLEVSPPDPGWAVLLTKEGAAVDELELDPDEAAALKLQVAPPEGLADGFLLSTVTARSLSSPGDAFDRVSATTRLKQPSSLELVAEETHLRMDPGKEALFRLRVRNTGLGTADVAFELQSDAPASWRPSRLFLLDPATGNRIGVSRLSIGHGEEATLFANVTSHPSERAGRTANLRVNAHTEDRAVEEVLQASVRAVHRLQATVPPLPIGVQALGANTTFRISLENRGNLDEVLRLAPGDLPAGWRLDVPAYLTIGRNATQAFDATLVAPVGAQPATYSVKLDLASRDGNHTLVPLPARVGAVGDGLAGALPTLLGEPGRVARVTVPVSNTGNVPLTIAAERAGGETWPTPVAPPALTLAPGARGALEYGWMVPANAPDGTTGHTLILVLRPDDVNAATRRQEVVVRIDVGRPDLVLRAATAYQGPAGTLVEAFVANTGTRDATAATVSLLDGAEVADRITLDRLPAGQSANVTLLRTGTPAQALAVVLDAEGTIVERDESNNQASAAPAAGRPAPSPQAALLALLLVALAASRRRAT